MAAKRNIVMNALLSAALAFNTFASFAAPENTNSAKTKAQKETSSDMKQRQGYDRLAVATLLSKGKTSQASEYVSVKSKEYTEKGMGELLDDLDGLSGLIEYEKESNAKLKKLGEEAINLEQKYPNLTYEAQLDAVEEQILNPLFETKERCMDVSGNSLNRKSIGVCKAIVKKIGELQNDLKFEREGRKALEGPYAKSAEITEKFNKFDSTSSNLETALKDADNLASLAKEVKGIMTQYGLNDKTAASYVESWGNAASQRREEISETIKKQPEIQKEKEEKAKAEDEEFKVKYGARDPLELYLGRFSKSQSGSSKASESGLDIKLRASTLHSYGTGFAPKNLKDLIYGNLIVEKTSGHGSIEGIGDYKEDSKQSLEVTAGINFWGDRDIHMHAGAGFKTENSQQTIAFSNSNTENAVIQNANGLVVEIGYDSKNVSAEYKHRKKNIMQTQELNKAGKMLASIGSQSNKDESELSIYVTPLESIRLEGSYNFMSGNDTMISNSSNLGIGFSAKLPRKVAEKSEFVKRTLGDASLNFKYNHEEGKRYTSSGWKIGVNIPFGNIYHNQRKVMRK